MNGSQQTIAEQHIGERIDKIMSYYSPEISRTKAQNLIDEGHILINGKDVRPNYKCKKGDHLSWEIPEETPRSIVPEDIPLHIVYEDDALIVINKESGMVVHPNHHQTTGTLVNGLLHYTNELAAIDSERPGIVHRIDKDTSGLLVVAKTDEALNILLEAFKKREVVRKYEALVHGQVAHEQGVIEAPIGRDPKNRLKMSVHSEGRYAKTTFKVLNRTNDYTHVSCALETGRTHQIRVHMQYINHPIVHDPLYGDGRNKHPKGQMLFASHLAFIHPITKEQMAFTIDPPASFEKERKIIGFH